MSEMQTPAAAAPSHLEPQFSSEEKNWLYAAHLGPLVIMLASGGLLSFVAPLAVYLHFKDKAPSVSEHARHSLNFQLTLLLVSVGLMAFALFTFGLGFFLAIPLVLILFVVEIVACIRASMQASESRPASYPLTLELVKA